MAVVPLTGANQELGLARKHPPHEDTRKCQNKVR